MIKIELLDAAERDITDGFRFYEQQAEGLGAYFVDTILSDIESLQLYAGIHELHYRYHRLLSKRFPFAIYYRLNGNTARVYAVLDCRSNPRRLGERLT